MKLVESALLACACLSLAGCISHEDTTYHDTERAKVEFESEVAARTFYEALSKQKQPAGEKTTRVSLPIVFDHTHREVTGPNISFNNAVQLCDTNKDGLITEVEARIFADFGAKKK